MKELALIKYDFQELKEIDNLKKFYNIYREDDLMIIEADKSNIDDITKRLSIVNDADLYSYYVTKENFLKRDEVDIVEMTTMFGSKIYSLEDLGGRDSIDGATFKINNSEFRFISPHTLEVIDINSKDDIHELARLLHETEY